MVTSKKILLYQIRNGIIKTIITILFIVYIAVIIFLANGLLEKGTVKSKINSFKNRATLVSETMLQGQNVKYYKVLKEYHYEDTSRFIYDPTNEDNHYIGAKTDIILTTRNPMRNYGDAIVRDVVGFLSHNFFIGHATINVEDDGSMYVESVGNDNGFYGVRLQPNSWIQTEVRYGNDAQTIIGLRLKNTNEEIRENICSELKNLIGKPYNKQIIFYKKDEYYCTDLISRVLKRFDINTNYDSLYTTGNDIIISDSVYIIFLCERISEGNFEIYYMGE